jgi:LysM repeat protein
MTPKKLEPKNNFDKNILASDDKFRREELVRLATAKDEEEERQKKEDILRLEKGQITFAEMKNMNADYEEELRVQEAQEELEKKQKKEDIQRMKANKITLAEIKKMNKEAETEKQKKMNEIRESIAAKISDKEIMQMNEEYAREQKRDKQTSQKRNLSPKNIDEGRRSFLSSFLPITKKIGQEIKDETETIFNIGEKKSLAEKGITRRNLLKRGGSMAMTLAAIKLWNLDGIAKGVWRKYKEEKDEDNYKVVDDTQIKEDDDIEDETKVTKNIDIEEMENKKNLLDYVKYENNHVEYGLEQEKQVENYWYDYFLGEGLPSFKEALSRIRVWTETKGADSNANIFLNEFVKKIDGGNNLSEEEKKRYVRMYMGLVLVESAGKVYEKSPVGAAGLHQFMPSTGHGYNLRQKYKEIIVKDKHHKKKKIKKLIVDDRYDPIKSCKACSNYLKDIYNEYHDDKLMLYQYNGVVGNYKKEAGGNVTRKGYLKWACDDINRIKRNIENLSEAFHEVHPGDDFSKIAKYYGISEKEIFTLNPGVNPRKIQIGDKIKLPLTDHVKEKLYYKMIAKYFENLNYATKITAAERAIEYLEENGMMPPPDKKIFIVREEPKTIKKLIKGRKGNTVISEQPTLNDYTSKMEKREAETFRMANQHIINEFERIPAGVKLNFTKRIG